MIGDEVMFLVDDPVSAAEIALGLADESREAAGLSDVRVGLAVGPVVEREGDAFGTTVNLAARATAIRSEEHTSELQSLMRISYAVFCLKKKTKTITTESNFISSN